MKKNGFKKMYVLPDKKYRVLIPSLIFLFTFRVTAQDCSQVYTFDINDKTSYSTSCGYQDGDSWKVVKNSCNFYTPLANVGGKAGDDKKWVDISVRIGNSGNLDDKDFAWIFYYINGKAQATKTIKGRDVDATYDFRDSVAVPAGGNFKLRIAFVCDEQDEYWNLTDGGLTTCVRAVEGEPGISGTISTGKVTFVKERDIVKLMWFSQPEPAGNYFRIERSKNGFDFEFAGYVKDRNDQGQVAAYSFIDAGSYKPQTWYRITRVNLQGNSQPFGKPVVVKF